MGAFTASRILISYLRTRRPADGSTLRVVPQPLNGRAVRPYCHSDVTVPRSTASRVAKAGTVSCSH